MMKSELDATAFGRGENISGRFMQCPHCKQENIPAASTCDCGYEFQTGIVRRPAAAERRTAAQARRTDPPIVWFLLAISLLASIGIVSTTPYDSTAGWSLLTIGYSLSFVCCLFFRVRSRTVGAT